MLNRLNRSLLITSIAGLAAISLAGCQGGASGPETNGSFNPETSTAVAAATEPPFAPVLTVGEGSESFEITDQTGSVITFNIAYPTAKVAGVQAEIAEKFAAAVAGRKDEVLESAQAYKKLSIPECQGACEREATFAVANAGVYEDYGTVATTSAFMFGARDRNPGVHSVTMNLKTGEAAELADFIDTAAPNALNAASDALKKTEKWAFCNESVAEYLGQVGAFSPTADGLLLLWPVNATHTAQCGVDSVTVPWLDANATAEASSDASADPATQAPADAPVAAPAAEDINGSWCPTAESPVDNGCITIALPTVSNVQDGTSYDISHVGDDSDGLQFATVGAPFGTYFPASVAIELPSYYPGADLPEQDRIWNGQTGVLLVRE